jgi:hypothetical protein
MRDNQLQEGKKYDQANSVKLYDKAYTPKGSVLRAEATIHNADDFRVYRRKEGDPKGPRAWRRLRRGIADLYRRTQLSHKAAARYLDAFATVDDTTTLDQLLSDWNNHGNGAAVGCVPSVP